MSTVLCITLELQIHINYHFIFLNSFLNVTIPDKVFGQVKSLEYGAVGFEGVVPFNTSTPAILPESESFIK